MISELFFSSRLPLRVNNLPSNPAIGGIRERGVSEKVYLEPSDFYYTFKGLQCKRLPQNYPIKSFLCHCLIGSFKGL